MKDKTSTYVLNEPIIGMRFWLGNKEFFTSYGRLALRSYSMEYPWRKGVNRATCHSWISIPDHPVPPVLIGGPTVEHCPAPKCGCGFNAFYDLASMQSTYSLWMPAHIIHNTPRPPMVGLVPVIIGLIRGWGRVHLHPNGWRSEYAEPLALFSGMETAYDRFIPEIAESYDIPVLSKKHALNPDALCEYGTLVPDDLKPIAHELPPIWGKKIVVS